MPAPPDPQAARAFERAFAYGRGVLPTPRRWVQHFWRVVNERVGAQVRAEAPAGGRVLFAGVGSGAVAGELTGYRVVGLDLNPTFLRDAALRCAGVGGDAARLPFADGAFDLVVLDRVLHHLVGQGALEPALDEAARVLRPGGVLWSCEPNLFHPSGLALNALNAFHLYHAVAGGSDHEFALSPRRVEGLLRRRFRHVETHALTFSHPRLPRTLQRLLFRADRRLEGLPLLAFCFVVRAVR